MISSKNAVQGAKSPQATNGNTSDSIWKEMAEAVRQPGPLRILLGVNFLSSLTSGILIPVLPLYFLETGLSFAELGSLFSLVALGTVGVQILSGRYTRFLARRAVLVPLLLVQPAMFPMFLWADSLPTFALVTALGAMAGGAAGPALQTLIASLATAKQRAFLYSKFGVVTSFSYAAGVIVGGVLLGMGYEVVFYAGSGLSLLSLLTMLRMQSFSASGDSGSMPSSKARGVAHARETTVGAVSASLAHAQQRIQAAHGKLAARSPVPVQCVRNVRLATVHLFLFGLTLAIYPVYFARYLVDLGLPVAWVGTAVAASWVVYGLVQPFGARYADRTGKYREVIAISLFCAAVLNYVMAITPLWGVLVAWVLLGIADGIGRPVTSALIVSGVPEKARGTAFGRTMAAMTAARIAAPLSLGLVIMGRGISFGLVWVSLVLCLAVLPILWFKPLRISSPDPGARATAAEVAS